MLGAGLGPIGYVFAIFHLVNHGFFKANMFLGAGSVMHSFNNQENMRRFGRSGPSCSSRFITFAAGWLAIMGVLPFSGFYSGTRSSRRRSRRTGSSVSPRTRCRHHGLLHDPSVHDATFLGKALDRRRHPHESPPVIDDPADHPRSARRSADSCSPGTGPSRTGWNRSPASSTRAPAAHLGDQWRHLLLVIVGALLAYQPVPPRRAADGTDVGLAADPGCSARPLRRRVQRGRVMRPGGT